MAFNSLLSAQPVGDEPEATIYRPPARPRSGETLALNDRDAALLTSLAAMQIEYGQPHEAVAYLMALRRMRPTDTQVLRLLSVALMKMGSWAEAEIIIEELEAIDHAPNPLVDLYRAFVRFRLKDLFGAKTYLARFIAARRAGGLA